MPDHVAAETQPPPTIPEEISSQLHSNELVVAVFDPDLDDRLHYAAGLIVLTTERVFSRSDSPAQSAAGHPAPAVFGWTAWKLNEISAAHAHDRGGLGCLELVGPAARLAVWQYTLNRALAAHGFVDRLTTLLAGVPHDRLPEPDLEPPEAEPAPKPPSVWALFRLLRFTRARAGMISLGFLLTIAATAAGLVPPYLTMPLVDEILIPFQDDVKKMSAPAGSDAAAQRAALALVQQEHRAHFTRVSWYLLGLAASAIAAWALSWGQGAVLAWVSERISADLRNQTYAHMQTLSLAFFGGRRTGDLMARVSTDTDRLCNFLSDSLVDFATDVLLIAGTAGVLLTIDPVLAISTLCPMPFIAWLIYRARGQLQHGFQQGGRAWGEMSSVLADTIPGIRVVKAFAQEQREIERFRRSNDRILEANDRVNAVWTFFWPMVNLMNQAGLLAVWAFGAWQVFNARITVGVLTAFLFYIGRFYMRLESMSRMVTATQRAAASAQRIFEILDRAPSVPEPAHPVRLPRMQGAIDFRQVGFRYGNRRVIEDLDFRIGAGEVIGLVGHTGAGKSTLVNLVCRFYDVSEGAILVDGVDIRSYVVEDYRRHIGIVLQDPFLFFGTIAENIAYGRPNATRAEIIAAARAARAHEFILQLPDGYDSLVGERGQSLSGGERQRVSIARALLIDPRILILDEATSAVDTQTEREIQEALDNLIKGRTTIAIAHRLSTLRKADRLVVLDRGRIVEVGHHLELLKKPGAYARLHEAQTKLAQDVAL